MLVSLGTSLIATAIRATIVVKIFTSPQQTVAPVQTRPLSIEGLHVLVHKNHPNAQSVMAAINQGLAAIKENGTYQQVINRHMSRIWSEL